MRIFYNIEVIYSMTGKSGLEKVTFCHFDQSGEVYKSLDFSTTLEMTISEFSSDSFGIY